MTTAQRDPGPWYALFAQQGDRYTLLSSDIVPPPGTAPRDVPAAYHQHDGLTVVHADERYTAYEMDWSLGSGKQHRLFIRYDDLGLTDWNGRPLTTPGLTADHVQALITRMKADEARAPIWEN